MKFSKLTEHVKTVADALNFMGFTTSPDQTQLKLTYRDLSKKMHPDAGGSTEKMQDLNAAYSILQNIRPGVSVGSGGTTRAPERDWDAERKAREERNGQAWEVMKDLLDKAFDAGHFLVYLKQFITEPFTIQTQISPKAHTVDQRYEPSISLTVEAANSDKTLVVYVMFHITAKTPPSNGLGSDDLDATDLLYSVSTQTEIYYAKRKQKIGQRDWKWRVGSKVLTDFEGILPPDRMRKIFSGKTSKIFKKADMMLGLEKEVGAIYGDGGRIDFPLFPKPSDSSHGYTTALVLSRSVILRSAAYQFSHVDYYASSGKRAWENVKCGYLEETEESMDRIIAFVKRIRAEVARFDEEADGPKIAALVKRDVEKEFHR